MKCHVTSLLVALGALLLAALSTGSPIFLMAAILLLVLLLYSLVSVLWASRTVRLHTLLSGQNVQRGQTVHLTVQVQCACPLPIAPVLLELAATPETASHDGHSRQWADGDASLSRGTRGRNVAGGQALRN